MPVADIFYTLDLIGTGVFAASGAVVLGVGLALFFTAPSTSNASSKRTIVVPMVTGDGAGLAAVGRF